MGGRPGAASPQQQPPDRRAQPPPSCRQELTATERSPHQPTCIATREVPELSQALPRGALYNLASLPSKSSSAAAAVAPSEQTGPLPRGAFGAAWNHPSSSSSGAAAAVLRETQGSQRTAEAALASWPAPLVGACSTAQREASYGGDGPVRVGTRTGQSGRNANGVLSVASGPLDWPRMGRCCVWRNALDFPGRPLPLSYFAHSSETSAARWQSAHSIAAHQPLEPHSVHRSYGGVRKRAEAALGELGPPTPGPTGDVVDGYRTAKLLCCGGLAGAVSRTITAPVDRLKFLMQVNSASHLTVRQGLALMANENTVKSYFRGNGANVAKNVPETAMKLTCNDRIKAMVVRDGHNITLGERLVVGAVSGGFAQAVIYPMEVIQTRLAATHGVYRGISDVVGSVWRKEGALAFYRGITPCMLGILPYAGLDITAFELMKERLSERYKGLPPPQVLLASGMLSSAGAMVLAYPLGFIRTRMQMDGRGGAPRQYGTMLDCFRQVIANEGWRGLYKGFGMSLAKIAPAAGISWFIFEESKAFLQCDNEDSNHDRH